MPIQPRSIAIKVAVFFFFLLSLLGLLAGLCPYTCCKRALAGALASYLLSVCVVRIVNIFALEAITSKLLKKYLNERNKG